jgi:hypothetical protein
MIFCPVVPEICRGQVYGPRKERKKENNIIRKISIGRHFQNGRHNTAQIQHCPISTPFHM